MDKRYLILRVEFDTQNDREATKLADEVVEFAGAVGDTYIVDEGFGPETEPEP